MAQYPHTNAVKNLINHGMTPEQISDECPALDLTVWRDGSIDACTWNRREQAQFDSYYESKLAELERAAQQPAQEEAQEPASKKQEAPAAPSQPPATPRQVAFIMRLIDQGRHKEGGFYNGPTECDQIAAMGRKDASMYIDSLLGNY